MSYSTASRLAVPDLTSRDTHRRPKVGVGVMIMRDEMVLLGKRRGAHGAATFGWCGGHVEFGETLEGAASREAREEAGIFVHDLTFLCVSNLIDRESGRHYLDVEFVCTEFEGEPHVREADYVESWDWYPLSQLPEPLFPAVAKAISSYQSKSCYNQ